MPDPRRSESTGERRRDALVVVLTLTTGALDAVTYLRLGKVFSSVITGNLALLGVAAGKHDSTLALNGGLALGGYACGVVAGSICAGMPDRRQPVWPARVTITLAIELAVLLAFSGEWLACAGRPAGASRWALLLLAAAAMGMQATGVRRLGQMSTTYLTSTLTGVLTGLAVRGWVSEWPRSVGLLIVITIGATLGALAAVKDPSWVPAAVLVPLIVVLLLAPRSRRRT